MKYFYSYVLRDRISGAEHGWGHGITDTSLPVYSADQLDTICFSIIEKLVNEKELQDVDKFIVHILSLSPLAFPSLLPFD